MSQFWYTQSGRTFVDFTVPQIAHHLDRIAKALESMVLAKAEEDNIREYPRCGWCDHRHFPTARCLVDDCECKE